MPEHGRARVAVGELDLDVGGRLVRELLHDGVVDEQDGRLLDGGDLGSGRAAGVAGREGRRPSPDGVAAAPMGT